MGENNYCQTTSSKDPYFLFFENDPQHEKYGLYEMAKCVDPGVRLSRSTILAHRHNQHFYPVLI